MKFVILGNGVVGLAVAFGLLRKAGAADEIVVVGPPARPGAATLAAAAMLNSFAEVEHGGLHSEIDRFRFELSRSAAALWPAFEAEVLEASDRRRLSSGVDGAPVDLGTYIVNNNAADDLDDLNFDAIVDALRAFDEPHTMVSPRDIPRYNPRQRYRAGRALYIPREGWLNPRLILEGLEAALRASPRVTFIGGEVEGLTHRGDEIVTADLGEGARVEGDRFVLATGATSWDLLNRSRLADLIQRIFYGIGASIEIRSPDAGLTNVIRTPNRGLACGIYSAPYFQPGGPNDRVLIGASNFISPDLHLHARLTSVEGLLAGAVNQINADYYRADLVRVNVGARPTSQDTYPLLGKTRMANVFVATGTKRDGFHLAPVIARDMADIVLGQPVDSRYAFFDPSRAPLRFLTREQAIDKAVRHQISAAYQHGFSPATNRMPAQIAQSFRDAAERLHDQVGATDWGIPPEMMDMYRYGHAAP